MKFVVIGNEKWELKKIFFFLLYRNYVDWQVGKGSALKKVTQDFFVEKKKYF